jgi:hypothetical protein
MHDLIMANPKKAGNHRPARLRPITRFGFREI